MSAGHGYLVEPWCVTERGLELDMLARSESVFALANGHIGLRGNLDEGDPHGLPGTYLNSVYELRPLPYAEAGYGYMQSGQTVINVTNGKLIRLLVDDEPFDIRYGTLDSHERVLDLRAGTLTRQVQWTSPAHDTVRISSVRLVSLTQRAGAAIAYEVEPVGDGPLRIVLQSELVANEELPPQSKDPRAAAALEHPLESEEHTAHGTHALLVHRTRHSKLRVAAGMDHIVEGPDQSSTEIMSSPDVCRLTTATVLRPGERLRIVKFLAYGWSSQRTRPALHDQVVAALAGARLSGWDGLLAEQRAYLDEFWAGADVEIDGDAEIQQAVRFGLFHILQAGARAEQRPIPAKGLTGPGYDGHTFWDTETFVLPVLTYTQRDAAADLLVETARLWRSLGHHDIDGNFRIDGVTGPDEYSAVADNNVFTNLMAQHNLHAARPVPAPAPLPVLRPLPQAGREAGRPGAGPAPAGRGVHARGEGAQLRLLRGADGAGLVAVGVHAGGGGGRDRPPRARLRLPGRGRARGPRRPEPQHRRRPAHGVARGRLDRPGRRLRGHAGRWWAAALRAPAAQRHRPARVPRAVPGPSHRGDCGARRGDLRAARGRADHHRAPRRRGGAGRQAGAAGHPAPAQPAPPRAARGSRPAAAGHVAGARRPGLIRRRQAVR